MSNQDISDQKELNHNDILPRLIRWGLYACALVPLIVFREFVSPFHFPKVAIFRPWIELLVILYTTLVLYDRRWLPKWNWLTKITTAFVGVYLLTSITGVNFDMSFWGTLERMGGWFSLVHLWFFFMLLVAMLRTKQQWMHMATFMVVSTGLSSIYGFLQKTNWEWIVGSGDRARIFGTIGNPALFAGFVLLGAFVAFALASLYKKRWQQLTLMGIGVMNLIAVFMTAVRGSAGGAIVALTLFAILYTRTRGSKIMKIILIILASLLLITLLFLISNHDADWVQNNSYLIRISDASLETRTVQTRFWTWQAGIDGWNDSMSRILLGYGPENFNIPFSQKFNPRFFDDGTGNDTIFDRAHNMFVEVLVTMGVVGFAVYIVMFALLFIYLRAIWKSTAQYRVAAAALASGLIAYILHNLFIFDTTANYILFFFIVAFVSFLREDNVAAQQNDTPPTPLVKDYIRYIIILLLILAMLLLSFNQSIQTTRANKALTRAVLASWAGEMQNAVNEFQDALAFDVLGRREYRNRYSAFIIENITNIQKAGLDGPALLRDSIAQQEKNIPSSDTEYLPYLYISRANSILGSSSSDHPANEEALAAALHAIDIAPTFVRSYYEVAQAYINLDQTVDAIEWYEKAIDLNHRVGRTWWLLAVAQIRIDDLESALTSIDNAFEYNYSFVGSEADLVRLGAFYQERNDFERLVQTYEVLTSINANEPQYQAILATAYAQLGRFDQAIQRAQRVIELDPSLEPEIQVFLDAYGLEL